MEILRPTNIQVVYSVYYYIKRYTGAYTRLSQFI